MDGASVSDPQDNHFRNSARGLRQHFCSACSRVFEGSQYDFGMAFNIRKVPYSVEFSKLRVVEPSSRSPRKFALRILVRVAAKIDESDVTLINFTQFRCEFLKSIQKLATCCATANITKNRTRWHVTPERFLAQHRITKNRRCKSTTLVISKNFPLISEVHNPQNTLSFEIFQTEGPGNATGAASAETDGWIVID